MWALIFIPAAAVFAIVIFLYLIFASFKSRPWYVSLIVVLGWFFSFSVLYLLPIDIVSTVYDECVSPNSSNVTISPEACAKPLLYISIRGRVVLWDVLYWTTYVATWAVFPFFQAYVSCGEFSVWTRSMAALRTNLIWYGVCAALAVAGALYVGFTRGWSWHVLLAMAIALGNTWGLLLVVLFMGVGLVLVPRLLWRRVRLAARELHVLARLGTLAKSTAEAEERLLLLMAKVRACDAGTPRFDETRPLVDQVVQSCPAEYARVRHGQGKASRRRAELVRLHRKLILALHGARGQRGQLEHQLRLALDLQQDAAALPPARRLGRLYAQPVLLAVITAAALLAGLLVLWSELTCSVTRPRLSIAAQLMRLPHAPLQLAVFAVFSYMGVCTFVALFRLRLFDFFQLIPHQHTDSHSLLFSAAYLSRLIFPLAYNFVMMAQISDRVGLLRAMGAVEMVPIFGEPFGVYFPIAMALVVLAALVHMHSHIFSALLVRWCGDNEIDSAEFHEDSPDDIQEGRSVLRKFQQQQAQSVASGAAGFRGKSDRSVYSSRWWDGEGNTPLLESSSDTSTFSKYGSSTEL